MHSKVFSDWLSSYVKTTRLFLKIFKMAGYLPNSPRTDEFTFIFCHFDSYEVLRLNMTNANASPSLPDLPRNASLMLLISAIDSVTVIRVFKVANRFVGGQTYRITPSNFSRLIKKFLCIEKSYSRLLHLLSSP